MKNSELVEFLGWKGTEARFKIKRGVLPNDRDLERIIVAREGNWMATMSALLPFGSNNHESVQARHGSGLKFLAKEYSKVMNRSLFSYSFESCEDAILAVPATGEELLFEIYGSDADHVMYPLVEREL